MKVALLVALMLLAGCGGASRTGATSGGLRPAVLHRQLQVSGVDRNYRLYTPPDVEDAVPYQGGRIIGAATKPAPAATAVAQRWASLDGCPNPATTDVRMPVRYSPAQFGIELQECEGDFTRLRSSGSEV